MADKSLIEQMLERLVNEDQAKAEELFHEYVVQKSREIYEGLIDSELSEEAEEDDEEVDEAAKDEEAEEDKVDESAEEEDDEEMDEGFEDVAIEADDEMDLAAGDPTDDLAGELGDEEGEEGEEKSEEELFMDLESIVDELQAKFDELKGDESGEEGGEEGEMGMKDALEPELATVREYVEKVAPAKMGDNGANAKSIVAGKNDMGGTTANILSSKEEPDNNRVGAGKKIQGSALNDQNPKEDNAGNINVPGGKAGNAFSKKEPGHGAEKKGEAEGKYSGTGAHSDSVSVNKQSLFRGRR